MMKDEKFEAELRAALAPVSASGNLKRQILLLPLEYPRSSGVQGSIPSKISAMRRPWYGSFVSLGSLAAAASLALGIFVGIGGLWGQTQTDDEVDLAGLAYDPSTSLGDL